VGGWEGQGGPRCRRAERSASGRPLGARTAGTAFEARGPRSGAAAYLLRVRISSTMLPGDLGSVSERLQKHRWVRGRIGSREAQEGQGGEE